MFKMFFVGILTVCTLGIAESHSPANSSAHTTRERETVSERFVSLESDQAQSVYSALSVLKNYKLKNAVSENPPFRYMIAKVKCMKIEVSKSSIKRAEVSYECYFNQDKTRSMGGIYAENLFKALEKTEAHKAQKEIPADLLTDKRLITELSLTNLYCGDPSKSLEDSACTFFTR